MVKCPAVRQTARPEVSIAPRRPWAANECTLSEHAPDGGRPAVRHSGARPTKTAGDLRSGTRAGSGDPRRTNVTESRPALTVACDGPAGRERESHRSACPPKGHNNQPRATAPGVNHARCVRLGHHGGDAISSGKRLVDLGHWGFGLAHGALRMNAATRIDGLMADRTAETSGDRGMEVFGVHPELSGGRDER